MTNFQKKTKRLALNTVMLYILTFSNYFLYLVTIPYQTRILGPSVFGEVGFAMSFTMYFQILIDFGFLIFATEIVSKYRHDKVKISQVLSIVTWCKMVLTLFSAIVLSILCLTIEPFTNDPLLYLLFFVSSALASFIPDFVYRGMENMRIVTIRTVLVRLFFVLMIFVFLNDTSDYYTIPLLSAIGNLAALAFVFMHVKTLGLRVSKVSLREMKQMFKQSSFFFYSRIATNIYSATNIFVLGIVYGPAAHAVGFYTSADRLITAAKLGVTPIVDSLYPYMVRYRDFQLIKKVLILGLPVMALGCVIVALFAEEICALLFGEEFRGSGEYLRLLTPVAFLAFPAMLFGFPVLSPMGLSKYANMSNVFGAVIQIFQVGLLFSLGQLTAVNICIVTCITEVATFGFRFIVFWKHRYLLKELKANNSVES